MELRKATRRKAKLRIGLAGPAGSGKTYSALKLASGIAPWNKIAMIDTENGSGELYSHLGEYNVISIAPPFSADRYVKAIKECENAGMEVIIIDSVTHVWKGQGGLLEYNSSLGGRFQDWAKTTPLYQNFLQAILQSSCHVITCVRKKTAYSMVTENGRTKVEKKGMEDEIRDGFEYELTVAFSLSQNHLAETSKDRTELFMDSPEFLITEKTGATLLKWAEEGDEPLTVEIPTLKQVAPVKTSKLEAGRATSHLESLKIELFKRDAKTAEAALSLLNLLCDDKYEDLNLTEGQAKKALIQILHQPYVKKPIKKVTPKKNA